LKLNNPKYHIYSKFIHLLKLLASVREKRVELRLERKGGFQQSKRLDVFKIMTGKASTLTKRASL
jgi:hypothetical protein